MKKNLFAVSLAISLAFIGAQSLSHAAEVKKEDAKKDEMAKVEKAKDDKKAEPKKEEVKK